MALAATLVPLAAHADEKVDVIVLQNGTRVVGEVKSMKKARLEVGTDDMGTLQIEWGNVVEVTAPGFFEVEDMAGRLFFGSLRRGPQQASVEVVADWGNDVGSTYLARNERNELLGGAGLSVNRERPVEGEATTNFEAAVGFSYANFAYDFPNTDIQVSSTAYLGLSQWGRFRLEANASLKRELFKDFYFGLRGYESYDSEPATEGAARNDWGLTLTLGYKF